MKRVKATPFPDAVAARSTGGGCSSTYSVKPIAGIVASADTASTPTGQSWCGLVATHRHRLLGRVVSLE